MPTNIVPYACSNCGESDELVLIIQIVGRVLLGRRVAKGIDTWATDGGPEHFEALDTHTHKVWCDACGTTMIPIEVDADE